MRKQFSNIPIKYKLHLVTLFTSSVALALLFILSTYFTKQSFTQSLTDELRSLTEVIADTVKPSLLFGDSVSASRNLGALRAKSNIRYAALTNKEGKILASYHREDLTEDVRANLHVLGVPVSCSPQSCSIYNEIVHEGERIGELVVDSDLSGLEVQQRKFAISIGLVSLVAFILSLLMSTILQELITGPIHALSETAAKVSSQKDYSLRAANNSSDELGLLTQTFNEMLEQIQERDTKLVKANQAKSDFVANTSHEIRTPINNIIGFTEMLEESAKEDYEKRFISLIKASAEGLLAVINDILDISKIEAGKLVLDPCPTDLSSHLGNLLSPLEAHAKKLGLGFQLALDPEIPKAIYVDPNRLGQVLINLVNNAIKFTAAPGQVSVGIAVQSQKTDSCTLLFSVKDSGIGISPNVQDSIFEAFQQADASTTRRYGGTGLGLAICQRIVNLMGSHIQVKSELEKGSLFYFEVTLPLSSPALLDDDSPFSSGSRGAHDLGTAAEEAPTEFRVLVVDDNPMSREITAHRLEKLGVAVSTAENGKIAVRITQEKNFDIIFMDCQMPEMDGFEATSHIRKNEQPKGTRVPIIALTAHAMDGYREICINAGMDDYLTKPIKEKELFRFFEEFCRDHPKRPRLS